MLAKYEAIKCDIIEKIENGIFTSGEKIYSESDLKKKYSVSNTTVVKALNDLVNEGYLIRRQGEGTFVRKNLKHRKVLFSEQLSLKNLQGKQRATEKSITIIYPIQINKEIAKKLGDESGKRKIIKLSQIALSNDVPWKIQNRYLFADRLNNDSIERLTKGASLSDELNLDKNMSTLPMIMNVSTVLLTLDSVELEPLKEINRTFSGETSFALFDITRLTMDEKGNPLEYSQSFIHPDYYYIEIINE